MAKLFFVAAAIFFFILYFHNVIEFDQDLGRHLLIGKIILESHAVPQTNLLSYSYPNFSYVNSHWLSEVIFYLVGVPRLVYFKTAVMLAATMITVYTAYKYSKNLAATALAFALFAPVLLERTEIRPEIFSYLFTAVFLYIILLRSKWLWLLVPLEILWVNVHIYFILGPALVAIYCLSARRYPLFAFLVLLVTLINPNGLTGALYPLRVFDNYGYSIVENQNIFFLREVIFNPNIFYFGVATLAFLGSFIFPFRRLPAVCYLLSALIVLPILHIRSFPLLFLILLPVFAFNLSKMTWKPIVAIVILLTLFRAERLASGEYYQTIGSSKRFGSSVNESYKGAVDFILANHLSGPIFNNFDIGSYLDYRLYPSYKVFVDGRPEAYPKEFFQNIYIPMQQSAANFTAVDKIVNFNLVIFSRTDGTPWGQQFLTDIIHNPKFNLVYLDDKTVVLTSQKNLPLARILPEPPGSRFVPSGLILF
ncbi:hypothetical protein HY440_00920 [Candidatus Microgenomates bacterium]|nr:hypothetical protein [Candidatus Microgenomates bacterium]